MVSLFFGGATCATADTSNKWRIEVDGGANSDGQMIFRVTPEGGETIVVRVTVKKGTGENRVAKTIRDAFEVQLPRDQYHVEVDDGEDVLVKKKCKGVNFALTFEGSTVKNTEVELEKE
jgi:hypothetical protein